MRFATQPHDAGICSNRLLSANGEYVTVSCTHCPSNQPSLVRMKLSRKILARQGRLSRHKVTVGEPAVGSPPINYFKKLQQDYFCVRVFIFLLINKLKKLNDLNWT